MIPHPWPELLPGDGVLTRGARGVSKLIRIFTTDWILGEDESEVNHAGVITTGGRMTAGITEALAGRRVWEYPFYQKYEEEDVAVFRPMNVTDDEREVLRQAAISFQGDWYTERVLLYQLVPFLVRILAAAYGDRWRICSWVLGATYDALGWDFGVDYRTADPDDIWDYVTAHLGTQYQWVIPPTWKPEAIWPEDAIVPDRWSQKWGLA